MDSQDQVCITPTFFMETLLLLTETVRQSQDGWGSLGDWQEVGAWVLRQKNSKPVAVVHFFGRIFVGAAPQLTYRLFLERLSEKGVLVIATPYASGFDHFPIADKVQFKYDRCKIFHLLALDILLDLSSIF
ncbi:uncharacterized protein LOC110880677 isoform X2 [Helianthus annuus]|uniref:uncharacterized protein LOC110880677 isoform X2 n=1 Tax=Helianthus annuus TaxID=4232 RepID=UPI001652C411|nr:uncharacterized protein LOC110880677 isoform X2 [Helianthus annuus]